VTRLPPKLLEGPCACGRPAELWLARTGLCRWCWRRATELEQLRRCDACGASWYGLAGEACGWCERREAYRDEAMQRAPAVDHGQVRLVWCPTHERAWRGLVGEVHGAHDLEHPSCNERGVSL
jgi:hypothetical protein